MSCRQFSALLGPYLTVAAISCGLAVPALGFGQTGNSINWDAGGHTKYRYMYTRVPENSVLQGINRDHIQDHALAARLKVAARREHWDFNAQAQLITLHSDILSATDQLSLPIFPGANLINDDRRWFNLTKTMSNTGENATLSRLDRISIGYTDEKTVFRFGRQAVSWGNGLLFTPMDIFNPFDPAAVDKEYKTGDDMLYAQYLLDNGNDIQAVAVVRRDSLSGDVEQNVSSLALKYHGFWLDNEYDLLLAEHYADRVLGLGGSTDFGGALWRGDLLWTDTDSGSLVSGVGGIGYSWSASQRNWSGTLEYYYNGFGQTGGDYSTAGFAANAELLQRIARGEVFSLGRHYLGTSITVELTPLTSLGSNIFVNLTDPSALAQLVLAYDWQQDSQILIALNLPIGANGSEYGGIESDQADEYFSTGPRLFVQLAWYF